MATKVNQIIDQGADFTTTIPVTSANGSPVDLTGYTGAAQMRKHYDAKKYYTFTITFPTPRANGNVVMSMTANTTNSIPAGRYVYDLEITAADGAKRRVVEGMVTVTPQVTR